MQKLIVVLMASLTVLVGYRGAPAQCIPDATGVHVMPIRLTRTISPVQAGTLAQLSGCTRSSLALPGVPFGPNPPSTCVLFNPPSTVMGQPQYARNVRLFFDDTLHNVSANGCSWPCANNCVVRGGDALPVELIGFGVQ